MVNKRKRSIKQIMDEHRTAIVVSTCVASVCIIFIISFISINIIPKYSCIAENNTWDDAQGKCVVPANSSPLQKLDGMTKKPCTVDDNGVEQCITGGGISLGNRDNHRITPTISHDTLSKLGIKTNINRDTDEISLDMGNDYLYINPETKMYERISSEEVTKLKESGKICLNADETWQNIGKDTCVAFFPTNYRSSNGIIFMNEKEDYKNGFTAPIMRDFITFDGVVDTYGGRTISVSGTIERYEGHPEIKVYVPRQIVQKPIVAGYNSKNGVIYRPG